MVGVTVNFLGLASVLLKLQSGILTKGTLKIRVPMRAAEWEIIVTLFSLAGVLALALRRRYHDVTMAIRRPLNMMGRTRGALSLNDLLLIITITIFVPLPLAFPLVARVVSRRINHRAKV